MVIPLFSRSSFSFVPETLSIALTTAILASLLYFVNKGENIGYVIALCLTPLAISTHLWEATVLLPGLTLLVLNKRYKHGVGFVAVVLAAVLFVNMIVSLQPSRSSSLLKYAVWNTGLGFFLTPDWWLARTVRPYDSSHPFLWGNISLLIGSIIASLGLSGLIVGRIKKYSAFSFDSLPKVPVFILSWMGAGLAIPLILPGGYFVHGSYYLWGVVAPVALTIGYGADEILSYHKFPANSGQIVLTVLLVTGSFYGAVFESTATMGPSEPGQLGVPASETKQVGSSLRSDSDIKYTDIVFVGTYSQWHSDNQSVYRSPAIRVTIYGHKNVKTVWRANRARGEWPYRYRTFNISTSCKVRVDRKEDNLTTSPCSSEGE